MVCCFSEFCRPVVSWCQGSTSWCVWKTWWETKRLGRTKETDGHASRTPCLVYVSGFHLCSLILFKKAKGGSCGVCNRLNAGANVSIVCFCSDGPVYDAYVCYTKEDFPFVETLLERLETPDLGIRLFILDRDLPAGRLKYRTFYQLMEKWYVLYPKYFLVCSTFIKAVLEQQDSI